MIRLIQRRLIIPRGDTGSFSIPALKSLASGDIAVFCSIDETTNSKVFEKQVAVEGETIVIAFSHADTVNLPVGKFVWDIKTYRNPQFVDEELVDGEEIDSYYAAFSLPVCEVRQTGDNLLEANEAPLTPAQVDFLTSTLNEMKQILQQSSTNVDHYPKIQENFWYTWDAGIEDYTNTGTRATPLYAYNIQYDRANKALTIVEVE